jgi:Phosphate-selective porin O and P
MEIVTMKNSPFFYLIALLSIVSFGQVKLDQHPQSSVISTSKTSLLNNVDVIFNTRLALDNYLNEGEFTKSQFSANELRLEVKGKVHDKVYFRFRNRFTKMPEPATIDNVYRSVDLAHLIIDLSPKSKLTLGKMIGDWAGYELLLNPIEVLSFNTVIQKSDLFLVGAAYSYSMPEMIFV